MPRMIRFNVEPMSAPVAASDRLRFSLRSAVTTAVVAAVLAFGGLVGTGGMGGPQSALAAGPNITVCVTQTQGYGVGSVPVTLYKWQPGVGAWTKYRTGTTKSGTSCGTFVDLAANSTYYAATAYTSLEGLRCSGRSGNVAPVTAAAAPITVACR